jgi:hypothetical protein
VFQSAATGRDGGFIYGSEALEGSTDAIERLEHPVPYVVMVTTQRFEI